MIETTVETDHSLTVFRVDGPVRPDEVLTAIEAFYADGPTRDALWDFRTTDSSRWTTEQVGDLLRRVARVVRNRDGGRTALVFGNAGDYGLGRVYETRADLQGLGLDIRSFHEVDEARDWLLSLPPAG